MEAGTSTSNGDLDIIAKADEELSKNGNQTKAANAKANKLKKKLKKKLSQLGIDILIICEGIDEDIDSSDENQNVSSKESKVKDEKDIDEKESEKHYDTDARRPESLDENHSVTNIKGKKSNLEAISENDTEELTESDNSDSDQSKSSGVLEEAKSETIGNNLDYGEAEAVNQNDNSEWNEENDNDEEKDNDTNIDMGGNTESKDKRGLNMDDTESDIADKTDDFDVDDVAKESNSGNGLDNPSTERTDNQIAKLDDCDTDYSNNQILTENAIQLNDKDGGKETVESTSKDSSVELFTSDNANSVHENPLCDGVEKGNEKEEVITCIDTKCDTIKETNVTDSSEENTNNDTADESESSDTANTESREEMQQEKSNSDETINSDKLDENKEISQVAAETEEGMVKQVESGCSVNNETVDMGREEEEAHVLNSSVNNDVNAAVCDRNLAVEIDDSSTDDDENSTVDVSIKLHIEENIKDFVDKSNLEISKGCEMENKMEKSDVRAAAGACDSDGVKEDNPAESIGDKSERVCEEVKSDPPASMEYKPDQESVDVKSTEQEWAQVFGVLENAEAELETVTKGSERSELQQTASKTKEDKWTKEKNKLETEIQQLKRELEMARAEVKSTQGSARDQQARHNQTVMSLKLQLYKMQVAQKRERAASEKRLADVMSHLLVLEGKLRKEQKSLGRDMRQKKELIKNQQTEIVKLRNQNEQLLNAIKEIYAKGGMNGYMRESKRKTSNSGDVFENGGKNGKDKKGGHSNGRLGSVRDKFSWKNRSSLELSSTSFNLEKYLIRNERLCTSQEDLQNIGKEGNKSIPNGENGHMTQDMRNMPRKRCQSVTDRPQFTFESKSPRNSTASPRNSQNFFSEDDYQNLNDMNKSTSESSQLSENSSGVYSCSDQDISMHDSVHSMNSSYYGNGDMYDDEDEGHFSFSSTHINTVIDEEDVMGPVIHSGQMMSMGSMPMLANYRDKQRSPSDKNRPHSLSSVDLAYIEQQTENLKLTGALVEDATPPSSPSYVQSKNEMTPFQTFKTMFKRKGSKNKGSKKRTVSLSQSTNKEYSEALKKHFQKYDMS